MSSSDNLENLVPEDVYDKAYADLSQLQTQLPERVVESLAREVLRRMARDTPELPVEPQEIEALSDALISKDAKAASSLIQRHHGNGVDANTLYLNYLGPAAHTLGTRWETDQISFADVTVGTGRIYAIMRTLNRQVSRRPVRDGKAAYFAVVPGEDHRLGLKMAADLARKEGWQIDLELDATHDELVEQITQSDHALIGLSAGGVHALPDLARLVLALRVSVPNALIMVSGNIVAIEHESISLMQVDGMARDFDGAMAKLAELWDTLQRPDA